MMKQKDGNIEIVKSSCFIGVTYWGRHEPQPDFLQNTTTLFVAPKGPVDRNAVQIG